MPQVQTWSSKVSSRLEEVGRTAGEYCTAITTDLSSLDDFVSTSTSQQVMRLNCRCVWPKLGFSSIWRSYVYVGSHSLASSQPCRYQLACVCFLLCVRLTGRTCLRVQTSLLDKHRSSLAEHLRAERAAAAAAAEKLQEDIRQQVERLVAEHTKTANRRLETAVAAFTSNAAEITTRACIHYVV